MYDDYILDGQAHGSVASTLLNNDFDAGVFRPYFQRTKQGRWVPYITRNVFDKNEGVWKPKAIVTNVDTVLRKDEWIELDRVVLTAARNRLRAVNDVRGRGLELTIPNGMGKTIHQYQTATDPGAVEVSMDGLRRSDTDRPTFDLRGTPLPIIHSDFEFTAREIATSRNDGTPLDNFMAEACSRRVAEQIEKMLVGTATAYSFGGYTINGWVDFTHTNTKTITAPTAVTWTPDQTVKEVLAMKTQSQDDNFYGPWMCYCSTQWDEYMDDDYSAVKGSNTLRQRIRNIDGIEDVRTLDTLATSNFPLLLVQMTSDVTRLLVGMDFVTMQWPSNGGMKLNFKVMAIIIPQIRAEKSNKCGIVYGTSA